MRAGAITVPAIVDETAVTLREESVALLHIHAVVAVSLLALDRGKLGVVSWVVVAVEHSLTPCEGCQTSVEPK